MFSCHIFTVTRTTTKKIRRKLIRGKLTALIRIRVIGMGRNISKICWQGVNVSRKGKKNQKKVKLHFSENKTY